MSIQQNARVFAAHTNVLKDKEVFRPLFKTADGKFEIVCYGDKSFCWVNSNLGIPVLYPFPEAVYNPVAEAVLMDLDGTSVNSEWFWIYLIQKTVAEIMGDPSFSFEESDLSHLSGYTTAEHLNYALNKYCPEKSLEEAIERYRRISAYEIHEITQGRGNISAFRPAKYLKEFLTELKKRGIKIGLVTSGLNYKAMPEITSVFYQLKMGDPLDFYDGIITGGEEKSKGRYGTIGEMASKPHPWLYAELGKIGLHMSDRTKVIGLEDSAAGVFSLRLAGYSVIGVDGGNIEASGVDHLCIHKSPDLLNALSFIIDK